MVENLLVNALRYVPSGGSVALRLECVGGSFRLGVSDDEPGIVPEDLPHVFERFFRADAAPAQGGTGLGFAIVTQYRWRGAGGGAGATRGKRARSWGARGPPAHQRGAVPAVERGLPRETLRPSASAGLRRGAGPPPLAPRAHRPLAAAHRPGGRRSRSEGPHGLTAGWPRRSEATPMKARAGTSLPK